jgi:hypothetical protein
LQAVPCIKKHTSGGSQQEDEDMVEADMDREDPFMVIHAFGTACFKKKIIIF